MGYLALFKPGVANFGYALFLSLSATSVWGGVYPYLGEQFRTAETTALFYLTQVAAFIVTLVARFALLSRFPQTSRKVYAFRASIPNFAGPLVLVTAMYTHTATLVLVIAAALLVGAGSALYLVSWQVVFASKDGTAANLSIATGTAFSALVYLVLCFVPIALTAYLIPLMLVPLEGLCLKLAAQGIDEELPMFSDVPDEHRDVYRNVLRENTVPALMVGALGFCSGAVRFISISSQELTAEINIISMATLLLIALVFIGLWQMKNLSLDLLNVYRFLFPLAGTCLIVLPFIGQGFANIASGLCYACFQLASMLVVMHCCQVSRDSGVSPVFIFAFYGILTYSFQFAGYLVGYLSGISETAKVEQLSLIALIALYLLLIAAILGRRKTRLHTARLEFFMLYPAKGSSASEEIARAEQVQHAAPARKQASPADSDQQPADRLGIQCQRLACKYQLSARETEIVELLARGGTGPSIAADLFISENTVRTHIKRIYAKLDVHKKHELLSLINATEADG